MSGTHTEEHHPVGEHNAEFIRLNARMRDVEQTVDEHSKSLAAGNIAFQMLREEVRDMDRQIESINKLTSSVEHFAGSVNLLSEKVERSIDTINDVNNRVVRIEDVDIKTEIAGLRREFKETTGTLSTEIQNIKDKPYQRFNYYLDKVVTYLLMGAVGLVLLALSNYALQWFIANSAEK